jgi:hypothetical protein
MLDNLPNIEPLPNLGSQVERAIVAWFVNLGISTFDQNYISNDTKPREIYKDSSVPRVINTTTANGSTVAVPESRIEIWNVTFEAEFIDAAINQPDQVDNNWNWKTINAWVGTHDAALSQKGDTDRDLKVTAGWITAAGRDLAVDDSNGTDPVQVKSAADNADMVNFTCQKIIFKGSTRVKKDGQGSLYFVEQRHYEIHAVPYNSD